MCGIKVNTASRVKVEENTQRGSQTLVMLAGHSRNKTVLQTAKIRVLDDKGNVITARLLFDSGCDRLYVSKKFVSKCKPEWVSGT